MLTVTLFATAFVSTGPVWLGTGRRAPSPELVLGWGAMGRPWVVGWVMGELVWGALAGMPPGEDFWLAIL